MLSLPLESLVTKHSIKLIQDRLAANDNRISNEIKDM